MERSEQINELVAALVQAQLSFKPIYKENENPAFRSKYADLSTIIAATQPALNAQGLTVIQFVRTKLELSITEIETMLAHVSGQWIKDTLELPATMRERFDAQSVGSSQTYGRRYAMQAILGVAAEIDDDGNGAVGNTKPSVQQPQRRSEQAGPMAAPKAEIPPMQTAFISDAQRKRLYAISKTAGWTDEELKTLLSQHGIKSSKEIPVDKYDLLCKQADVGAPEPSSANTH